MSARRLARGAPLASTRSFAAWIALAASALPLAACAASVPLPKEGDHTGDPRVYVPYPPPPPQVEILPPMPEQKGVVWVDGQWMWRGRRWEWQRGGWVVPLPGATYAWPAIEYGPELRVGWIAGAWHVPATR